MRFFFILLFLSQLAFAATPAGVLSSEQSEREGGQVGKTPSSERRQTAATVSENLPAEGALPAPVIDQEARAIADELRCPVCRGIPIAESPSELAQDMMQTIRQKLSEGQNKEAILKYFEDRYGEWILLRPKARGLNLVVWVLPMLILVGGGLFLISRISKWSRRET